MNSRDFTPLDPRTGIIKEFEGLDRVEKAVLKHLRTVLVEDPFWVSGKGPVRLARDSYNQQCPMHCMLDLAGYGSRGQVWLASVTATAQADLLEAHGVTHVYSAGYQKMQTRDFQRFTFLPVHDGTGLMAGDISLDAVLRELRELIDLVMKGYRVCICCRNGAHRSALLCALLLLMLTGRRPGDIAQYMCRLRSIVDLRSAPPNRQLGTPLEFLEQHAQAVSAFRQKTKGPVLSLNQVVNKSAFRGMCANLMAAQPALGSGSMEPVRLQEGPHLQAKSQPKAKAKDKGKGKGEPKAKVKVKAMPKFQPKQDAEGSGGSPGMAQPVPAMPEAGSSGGSPGEAAPTSAEQPEQAKQAEAASALASAAAASAGVKREGADAAAAEASGKKAKTELGAAPAAAASLEPSADPAASANLAPSAAPATAAMPEPEAKKPKTEAEAAASTETETARNASLMKEVVGTLVAMHKRVRELAERESARSSSAATSLEEEVDFDPDDAEVDVDAACAGMGPESKELLDLLLKEQRRLSSQLEELATKKEADSSEAELLERAWKAVRDQDPLAAEAALRKLTPRAVSGMRDVAGVTPLHVAARERWLGLTGYLLEVAPGMACAVTGERQPPHWTPFMSLANSPKAQDGAVADREWEVVALLLQHMDMDALNVQSGTGATATHMGVPKGNHALVEQLLWRLYELGGWKAVEHHLGLANNSGKSALDLAFRSNTAFARRLQNEWWAPSYTPPPAQDERWYAWRQRKGSGR